MMTPTLLLLPAGALLMRLLWLQLWLPEAWECTCSLCQSCCWALLLCSLQGLQRTGEEEEEEEAALLQLLLALQSLRRSSPRQSFKQRQVAPPMRGALTEQSRAWAPWSSSRRLWSSSRRCWQQSRGSRQQEEQEGRELAGPGCSSSCLQRLSSLLRLQEQCSSWLCPVALCWWLRRRRLC